MYAGRRLKSSYFALKNTNHNCPEKVTYVREANNIGDYPL